jgi:hypothetical protein
LLPSLFQEENAMPMLTSEQAFDMLPIVVEVYNKLEVDKYRKDLAKKYEGKKVDQISIGIEAFKFVLKNSGKVKEQIFGIVAVFEGKPVEEIKNQSFVKTVMTFKAIFSDKDLVDFFKQAMR